MAPSKNATEAERNPTGPQMHHICPILGVSVLGLIFDINSSSYNSEMFAHHRAGWRATAAAAVEAAFDPLLHTCTAWMTVDALCYGVPCL